MRTFLRDIQSGLYFRGKLAYARRFARPPDPSEPVAAGGVLVITSNAGLRAVDTPVTMESFRAFAVGEIDLRNAAYRAPLEQSAKALREARSGEVRRLGEAVQRQAFAEAEHQLAKPTSM